MKTMPSFRIVDADRNLLECDYEKDNPNSLVLDFGRSPSKRSEGNVDLEKNAKQWGLHLPVAKAPDFKDFFVYATPRQKILVVSASGYEGRSLLRENNWVVLTFTPFGSKDTLQLPVRVIRVSECANPKEEFDVESHTVLIEWLDDYDFGTFEVSENTGILFQQQVENLIICGKPNGDPGSIRDFTDTDFVALASDFPAVLGTPSFEFKGNKSVIVSVIDTGLWYKLGDEKNNLIGTYLNSETNKQTFDVAEIERIESQNDRLRGNSWGYCAVTSYLRSCKDADNVFDAEYKTNPDYQNLATRTKLEILNTPYDDNQVESLNPERSEGRHGSIISAVINQQGKVPVLPVKAFNCAGWGTIYDLLCSLNYVLACKKAGMNIQIINASFEGRLNPGGYELLKKKFEQLEKNKIWVIAAAGNEGQELIFDDFKTMPSATGVDAVNVFPACFSKIFNNVITVTDVSPFIKFERKDLHNRDLSYAKINLNERIKQDLNLDLDLYDWFSGYHFNGNYSTEFVNAAVVSAYPSPSNGKPLHGTSFAVSYFSGKLAEYLTTNPTEPSDAATRQNVIDAITESTTELSGRIQNGALLKMDNGPVF